MPVQTDHAGMAALAICEALLLAISDHRLLPESEIAGILRDAAAAHENAVGDTAEMEMHQSVACLINGINAGMNSSGLHRG
ncbi:hypothetical protein [Gemmobacter sp. 24YEA27]|uniref:hypothetical protein n=1 Tax=Gemmobacter sp. 24YEA27 TaxID=3040672 RepID=UPI0024B337AD|nr:hypothetical protein [Gemmobacter sp. 24YEA27]